MGHRDQCAFTERSIRRRTFADGWTTSANTTFERTKPIRPISLLVRHIDSDRYEQQRSINCIDGHKHPTPVVFIAHNIGCCFSSFIANETIVHQRDRSSRTIVGFFIRMVYRSTSGARFAFFTVHHRTRALSLPSTRCISFAQFIVHHYSAIDSTLSSVLIITSSFVLVHHCSAVFIVIVVRPASSWPAIASAKASTACISFTRHRRYLYVFLCLRLSSLSLLLGSLADQKRTQRTVISKLFAFSAASPPNDL